MMYNKTIIIVKNKPWELAVAIDDYLKSYSRNQHEYDYGYVIQYQMVRGLFRIKYSAIIHFWVS